MIRKVLGLTNEGGVNLVEELKRAEEAMNNVSLLYEVKSSVDILSVQIKATNNKVDTITATFESHMMDERRWRNELSQTIKDCPEKKAIEFQGRELSAHGQYILAQNGKIDRLREKVADSTDVLHSRISNLATNVDKNSGVVSLWGKIWTGIGIIVIALAVLDRVWGRHDTDNKEPPQQKVERKLESIK